MTAVAFFADENVLPALHVAIASTLANWSERSPLELWLFHRGIGHAGLKAIESTIAISKKNVVWMPRPFDVSRVEKWRSLYGSHMPYGRLFLPDLLDGRDEVVYLDADVIVDLDVTSLPRATSDSFLLAMEAWDFAHSHDAEIAARFGIAATDVYFHSGFLIWNLGRCREADLVRRFVEFGDRHADLLMSHDQTILNVVCHGGIGAIPPNLTSHLYPTSSRSPGAAVQTIQNFCGAPKPFDPFGNVLNDHYALFESWIGRTALRGWSPNELGQLARVSRNVRLIRPMLSTAAKMMLRRLRHQNDTK